MQISVYAQESVLVEIDSLKTLYENESNNIERVKILNELAFLSLFTEIPKVKIFADQALEIAIAEEDEIGIGDAESRLGLYFKAVGELDSAIVHFHKSLEIRKTIGRPDLEANLYYNLGRLLDASGQFDSALVMFHQALAIYKTEDTYESDIAGTYNRMSEVYKNMGNYQEALIYCEKGLDIHQNLPNPNHKEIGNSLMNLGTIYTHLDKYDNALVQYNQATFYFEQLDDTRGLEKIYLNKGVNFSKKGELDSATIAYEKALNLSEQSGNIEERCNLLLNLGSLYIRKGEYDNAQSFLLTAIPLAKNAGDKSTLSLCWHNLAEVAYAQADYERALLCYHKSLELAEKLAERLTRGDIYEGIANTYTKLRRYDSANVYFLLNNRIRDTLLNADRATLELEKQLKVALLDREKAELSVELNKTKSINQTITIVALSIVILLMTLAFYYFQRASKEKQKVIITELETENKVLAFQKEIDDMIKEQDTQSIQQILEGQEEERERVAADLHARLGSLLSSLKWNVESMEELFKDDENKPSISTLNTMVEEIIREMRNISHNMTSGILNDFGLESAIKNLVETFNGKDIDIQLFSHDFEHRLPKSIELGLYRIAQEALANALKHANASEIIIQLNHFSDKVNLLIEDNGNGFDLQRASKKKGLGLKNIRYRAIQLGGEANIDSKPEVGTTISVDVPIEPLS